MRTSSEDHSSQETPQGSIQLRTNGASFPTLESDVSAVRRDIQQSCQCPIDRLPPELLLHIMSLSSENLPWVLGHVCSRWRSLSRANQRLWEHVKIKAYPTTSIERIQRFVEIVPPVALFDLIYENLYYDSGFKPLAPYLSRCQSLQVYGDMEAYNDLWRNLPQDAFVNLRSVSFRFGFRSGSSVFEWPAATETLWASTAARWAVARNLYDAKFVLDVYEEAHRASSAVLSSIPLPWHQLRYIYIYVGGLNDVDYLRAYLQRCHHALTTVHLHVYASEHTFSRAVDIKASTFDFPNLRNVVIEGLSYPTLLPEYIWRNLTSLKISPSCGQVYPEPAALQRIFEMCCAQLRRLSIMSPAPRSGTFGAARVPLRRLHFPLLRSLEVRLSDINDDRDDAPRPWKLDVTLIDAPGLQET
ncbi:hypothetical protein H0H92_011611 [Tricholoma furcatifolium]|nr:hypothetical protein H0H92_011611 [Tricholoma furcatifolium]